MQNLNNCIYCENNNPSTHIICTICKKGMCSQCYDGYVEHELHYQDIIEHCETEREIKLITEACNGAPEYICELCVENILK